MTMGPMDASADPLLRALRSAVSAASGAAARPGQLRSRLEAELGPDDAARFRGSVHQLVAAAEEHVPATLSNQTPVSREAVERVAGDLARTRGWTMDAALQTTSLWAAALGLADAASLGLAVRPSIPPPPPAEAATPETAGEPARTPTPVAWDPNAPAVWDAAPAAVTSVPPVVTPAVAPTPPPAPPATPVPPPPVPAAPLPPPLAPGPITTPRHAAAGGPAGPLPDWPKSKRRLVGLKRPETGTPVAYATGYAGISVVAYVIAIVVELVALVSAAIVLTPEGSSTGGRPVLLMAVGAGIALGLGAMLKPGLVIATEEGLEYTQLDPRMTKPKPATTVFAPWSELHVNVGRISRVQIGARTIQLGPKNRAFATAAAARAEGAA